ncbi:bifunctional molybdenum cofactor biosynthesis protein MoaC/MoaB [Nocardia sp. NBC_00508]|uniref:bifunctional molybdenum cofactor biosynthesis protein MoaC/MoaB n=1 Tax=Nocardia sp. NBC_00508 TaxID=2975992 RepID=UPI002E819E08|nr:bifunctional molybdenum cofactor biosynthesis protein MoaC/MoaB [Nocardia sp. NBC_00508]WUD64756.1 bifunctional molybdenum cofactor biosynthesis protein MoaC/MoaB [Nocardia sp. NBC_00508]
MSELSHVDDEGRARMVDVSAKDDTTRIAVAAGELRTTAEVVALVRADNLPKADVLSTARIAGIAGAKKTSELIPLCHQLALSSVRVEFGFTDTGITIEATAKTKGPTGVEMEALTAVAVAGLTLHDMVKAVDPAATLTEVRLLTKEGGKHGHWVRPAAAEPIETTDETADDDAVAAEEISEYAEAEPDEAERSAVVLVSSTGVAAGTRVDTTGPVLVEWLADLGFSVRGPLVYADADIEFGLADALRFEPALVISTGGTGASPTDGTPEVTLALLDRELPGVAEAIRQRGTAKFPLAALSRGVAGLAGRSVIVNLPGSPGGVKDGMAVLEPLLDHLLAQVAGGGSHDNG